MFKTVTQAKASAAPLAIDMAPLIDIVFILLIFFLVTTTFAPSEAVDVTRPEAATGAVQPLDTLRVTYAPGGQIFIDGASIERVTLTDAARAFQRRMPDGGAVLIADEQTALAELTPIMDDLRAGGVTTIALATREAAP